MKHPRPIGVMDEMIVRREYENSTTNWWIVGRSRLFHTLFHAAPIPHGCKVLEIGPGAGGNLSVWQFQSSPFLVLADADQVALNVALTQGPASGAIIDASRLPFVNASFHQILMGDVLEHLPDDEGAMKEVARVLQPEGLLVLTVPAYQFLWGQQDKLVGHQRRYRLRQLKKLVLNSGLDIQLVTYINWIMFPIAVGFKLFMRVLRPRNYSDATSVPQFTNRLLLRIFLFDLSVAQKVRIPFGLSILVVATKPTQTSADSRRKKCNHKQ